MHVDLGCAGRPRGDVNIDINQYPYPGAMRCNLGFERIPLENNIADKVTAYDFIEHIPFYIYLSKTGEKYSPMESLFAEVARILKPRGTFFIKVPAFPYSCAFQDPSHMSCWTENTAPYLTGPQINSEGKIEGTFEVIQNVVVGPYMEIIYRKK